MLRDFSLRDFGASLNTVESYTNESSQGKIGLCETVNKQKCTHLGMFLASDYRTFQKWKEDINTKQPVLVKDSMGNVWFGTIVEHTYTPDYTGGNYQLYTIKINFEQTRDMNKTRILTD